MKILPRLTLAITSLMVLATAGYVLLDLRGRAARHRTQIEDEARHVALSLRAVLERTPEPLALPQGLDAATTGWHVNMLRVTDARTATPAQQQRMGAIVEAPKTTFLDVGPHEIRYAVGLRRPGAGNAAEVYAMLEVTRPLAELHAERIRQRWQAFGLVALVGTLSALGTAWFTRRLVTRPIGKLLRGIDEVAKGDLSHALFTETNDEVGAIASRFNDMTYSLRESRNETSRQSQVRLGLEQRLSHTEKLATIGQLAAEIAHEVGTPLAVIAGRAKATARKAQDPTVVIKNAEIIAEQTARITKIIQRLLDFSRRRVGGTPPAPVNLNELALTTMELLSTQFAHNKLRTRLLRAEGLALVKGDADRLQQVMINLLLNGAQAMPQGGTLELETANVRRTRPGLTDAQPSAFVELTVRDDGPGIPPELRDRIFEPFFSTKDQLGGTGLGLAVSHGIVKEHDGWIEVDTAATTSGAVFRVYVPSLPTAL